MTPEEQAEVGKNAAQGEADALAQFESGYTGKAIDEPTPETPDIPAPIVEGEQPPKVEATENPGNEPPAETPETPTASQVPISPEQIQRLLEAANSIGDIRSAVEKLRGDAFGRMGGLERTLKTLQDATPAGQPIELTSDDLAEVKKEYPDLTENLVAGLSRVFKKIKGTGAANGVKIEDVDQRVAERASVIAQEVITREGARIREEVATQMLEAQHEGWRELVGPKDSDTAYRRWLKAQGPEVEKRLLSSNDPVEIGRSITKFKDAQKAAKPAAAVKKPASPDHDRKQQLAEAITPRGGKPPAPRAKTPEEEFAEGFEYQGAAR